jgi:hypothetical protein
VDIRGALIEAHESSEAWIVGESDRFWVYPRPAAEWLFQNPLRNHLVPPALSAYIKSNWSPSGAQSPPSARLAPPAQARERPAAVLDAAAPPPIASPCASTEVPCEAGLAAEVTNSGPGGAKSVVSESELRGFLNEQADGRKKEQDLKASATTHFAPKVITQRRWRVVWKECPKKRRPGDTDLTIERNRSDNTSA